MTHETRKRKLDYRPFHDASIVRVQEKWDKTSTIVIGPPTANKTIYIARWNDGAGTYYKQAWKLEF